MTKKIKWRLGKLPTVDELRDLIKDKVITQEEAREILFSETDEETPEPASLESLQAEVKALRELVMAIASRPSEIIRIVDRYREYPWYKPYYTWAMSVKEMPNTVPAIYSGTDTASLSAGKFDNIMQVSNKVDSGISIGTARN